MMKKLLLACLVLVLALCLLPTKAQAASSGTCGDNLTWTLDDEGTLTISGTGKMQDWSNSSYAPWDSHRSSIKKVIIGDGVESIGNYAFYNYYNLASVTIGDSVKSIGHRVFYSCDYLAEVTIPDSVTSIGNYAFRDCYALTDVTLGNGITSIGSFAFESCSGLVNLYITDLAAWCGISFDTYDANPLYYADNFYLNGKLVTNMTIPEGVTAIGKYAFQSYSGLTGVIIPNSVEIIGNSAFSSCDKLTSVTFGDSIKSIGNSAFSNCDSLTDVTIPDSVESIGESAFNGCDNLTSAYITDPNAWCKISFGNGSANPAYGGRLYILDEDGNRVTKLVLDDTVAVIPDYAFYGSTITEVTIPDSVTSIGTAAFCYCDKLTSVTIGNSVTGIGDDAFSYCEKLTSVTLGNSVTSIDSSAFYACGSLTDVYITNINTWVKNSLGTNIIDDGIHLHILDEEGNEVTELTFDNTITAIPDYAFYGSTVTTVTIPDSVESIGYGAFSYCNKLTSVTIGDSVESIGDCAFYCCDKLISVTIGDSVESIGDYAFSYCYSLTDVTIPSSVKSIGDDAFYSCNSLTNVYYAGLETQWNAISIGSWNGPLNSATIHYSHIHDYTLFPGKTVEPTCTEQGYTEYTCAYGDTYREYISPLGHAAGSNAVVTPPTCTEGGYTTSNCARCKQLVETELVPALGHDYIGPIITVEPTCSQEGFSGHSCTRCSDVERKNVTNAVAHKMVVVPATEPTCTQPGLTQGTVCQWCGLVGIAQQESAPACGHSYINHEAKTPSCTEIGWEAYQTCEKCDYTSYEELPAGHQVYMQTTDRIDPITVDNSGPIPFELINGIYYSANHSDNSSSEFIITALYDCILTLNYGVSSEMNYDYLRILHNGDLLRAVCGSNLGELSITLVAGDVVTIYYGKDSSGSAGEDRGWVRLVYEEIGEPEMKYVLIEALNPTCENSVTCIGCGTMFGHTIAEHEAKAPTCTEIGWEAYQACENCEYSTRVEIPAVGHSYVDHKCTVCAAEEEVPQGNDTNKHDDDDDDDDDNNEYDDGYNYEEDEGIVGIIIIVAVVVVVAAAVATLLILKKKKKVTT